MEKVEMYKLPQYIGRDGGVSVEGTVVKRVEGGAKVVFFYITYGQHCLQCVGKLESLGSESALGDLWHNVRTGSNVLFSGNVQRSDARAIRLGKTRKQKKKLFCTLGCELNVQSFQVL